LTPGNSANKTSAILPTAATETTKAGGVIAVVTNSSAVSTPFNANKSAVSQGVALVNAASTTTISELEKRVELPASVKIERDGEKGIQVSANNGWTGRVSVSVMNGNSDSDVETFVEIVITPTAITAPKILQEQPTAIQKVGETPKPGLFVTWAPSQSEVVGYIVTVNSQPTCFSMTTSCEINQLIGPKTKVAVIAQGNDNTFSTSAPLPAFKPTRPVPALVVNFAVASSILSPKFKADLRDLAKVMVKAGFTKVDIAGHTDSTGQKIGYDNQQLSDARAKATLTYLKRFVPKLKSVTGAYAYERRITDESTTEALYVNRRAEVAVS
jgi:outer membrane protein OmpA-like peptidoglycan-associated protein